MKNNNFIKKGNIKYKNRIKIVSMILIMITLINICNMSSASLIENDITVIERWRGVIPFSYDNEDRISVARSAKGLPVYAKNKNNDGGINFTPSKFEKCNDSRIINVLKNGYGGKTLEELNGPSEIQAFLATQEAIYTILEGRNLADYETFDNEGIHIIEIAQEILDNANKEASETKDTIELIQKDECWKDYEADNNFKYKEYTVSSNIEDEGKIDIQKGANIKIIDKTTNTIKQTFLANDTFYLVVPKNVEQEINVKFSYEKEQFSVYSFKESEELDATYLLPILSPITTSINETIKGDSKVKIINKDSETNEPIIGNTFSIIKEDNATVKENLVTDDNGMIDISLDNGKYYLKQIGAIGEYSINKALIEINIANHEPVTININSSKDITEESTNVEKEINVNEENKKVIENNITEVSNIKTTNINREITNETNETNLSNVNNFINTINRKNVLNLEKANTYRNYITEQGMTENRILEGENKTLNMTRQDYINYIDMIMLNSARVPILPVASK